MIRRISSKEPLPAIRAALVQQLTRPSQATAFTFPAQCYRAPRVNHGWLAAIKAQVRKIIANAQGKTLMVRMIGVALLACVIQIIGVAV